MAGDGRDAAFGVARRRAIEMATSMGFLDFFAEQSPLGGLGLVRARLRADRSAIRTRRSQHSRRGEKRTREKLDRLGRGHGFPFRGEPLQIRGHGL